MEPAEYFRALVEPTIQEFENDPDNIRRAYLACIVAYHFSDAVSDYAKITKTSVRKDLSKLSKAFPVIEGVANMIKHITVTEVKVRPKMKDSDIRRAAPFSDGTRFSDGTGFASGDMVATVKDQNGRIHDLRWCLRQVRGSIETYLKSREAAITVP